ncbi:MAG: adenosine deaminase [Candidatus Marinimicrobia bacterium]|nr:adenosine deaminase [Candidatus Neomarinimicrobiota bacterium]
MVNFTKIPKIELHLHLEGAIPLDTLWQLINKYDPVLSKTLTLESLNSKFQYTNFHHFLQLWSWKNTFIREPDDFTHIAQAVARQLKHQNIIYAEAFFSPPDFAHTGLDVSLISQSIRQGLAMVDGIHVNLIADLVRGSDTAMAGLMLDQVLELKNEGVIGIGLGGDEAKHPPGLYKGIYTKAKHHDLHTTVHAGEALGPTSIWEALTELHPDRIGHGIRAVEDPKLLAYLKDHRIPLEICPFSNIRTALYPHYSDHPVRTLYDLGIPISINSDDPVLFQTSLAAEFQGLREIHRFTDLEILQLLLDATDQSFADDIQKLSLKKQIFSHPQWSSLPENDKLRSTSFT